MIKIKKMEKNSSLLIIFLFAGFTFIKSEKCNPSIFYITAIQCCMCINIFTIFIFPAVGFFTVTCLCHTVKSLLTLKKLLNEGQIQISKMQIILELYELLQRLIQKNRKMILSWSTQCSPSSFSDFCSLLVTLVSQIPLWLQIIFIKDPVCMS
jgi:hypothetical protein